MLRRLPISLRFDDEESDFYYGFIEQKKNDRELSTLILDLLHVYFEDEGVRNRVDEYVLNKSPYMHIHAELERIALEHSRQRVSTSMLGDFTDNERKKVTEPPVEKEVVKSEEVSKENNNSESQPVLTLPEGVIAEIQKNVTENVLATMIPNFAESIMNYMASNNMTGQVIANTQVGSAKEVEIKKEETVVEQPEVEIKPVVEEVKKEKPVVSINIPTENSSVSETKPEVAPPTVSTEESTVKKPASFGKLLKSVK